MSQNATAQQARTVSANASSNGLLDIKSLVLLAILLAAGFILNMTLGNALAIVGIKPQFIIAAYALAIMLSACVIQLTTSIPGLNFLTEVVAAIAMALLVKANVGGSKACPLVSAFLTTLISGALFAVLGTVIMGAALPTVVVKVPLVLGTAVFNAIVVQALYIPLNKVLNK